MSASSLPDSGRSALAVLCDGSRAAVRLLAADPSLEQRLLEQQACASPLLATRLAAAWPEPQDSEGLARAMRRDRSLLFLHTALRDLNGLAPLEEVMRAWTLFAEAAVCAASLAAEHGLEARHGRPREGTSGPRQRLIPVAMGKLGGGELNVSSDVDLVFCFAEAGMSDGPTPISNQEFFAQATRRVVRLLDERSADGYVFRVDTRLRPDGPIGPPAISFAALEQYLESQGRPWERHAWLKARALTDVPGEGLARLVEPFVYRRYLDYGAIAALRELHTRMLNDHSRREREQDVKIGPGGIREIEFTAQLFQLIRGGQDPGLRLRPTRAALAALGERGILDARTAAELDETYVFLRRVEHRLQYFDDAQTHRLPGPGADLEQLAANLGFTGSDALMAELQSRRSQVSALFARALGRAPAHPAAPEGAQADAQALAALAADQRQAAAEAWAAVQADDPQTARSALMRLGAEDAAASLPFLEDLARGRAWRSASEAGRARLGRLVRQALALAVSRPPIGRTLRGMFGVLNAIGGRETYFALLDEFPAALARLADICAASPWAADFLARFPALLDELVHLQDLHRQLDAGGIAAEVRQAVTARAGDVEAQMDALRRVRQRFQFRLALLDIEGLISVPELGDRLADLADACLAAALSEAAGAQGVRGFAVIGFGKLGGKELGYNSDLDLVFVYDPEHIPGERAARLAQKLITWLATPTGAGIAYETDIRLRPDGVSGLLVSSLPALRDYERQRAWTWEHQALSRARACAGDPQVGEAFEALRREILALPRDRAQLRAEVAEMRARMAREHAPRQGGWDVKHGPGGLVDIEFMVQYLVLGYAHDHPELLANPGNIALLHTCGRLGLAPAEDCAAVAEAYAHLRALQHRLQLSGETGGTLARSEAEPGAGRVEALWQQLFGGSVH